MQDRGAETEGDRVSSIPPYQAIRAEDWPNVDEWREVIDPFFDAHRIAFVARPAIVREPAAPATAWVTAAREAWGLPSPTLADWARRIDPDVDQKVAELDLLTSHVLYPKDYDHDARRRRARICAELRGEA